MITKKCPYCGDEKELDLFKKDKRRSDGRATECKKCANKSYSIYQKKTRDIQWNRLKKWRDKNKEHVCSQSVKYLQTPYGKIKKSANQKVYHAIKNGKLKKQSCEICGKVAQAHHKDYSKPLEINWLCRKHHAEWHLKNNITIWTTMK